MGAPHRKLHARKRIAYVQLLPQPDATAWRLHVTRACSGRLRSASAAGAAEATV